MRIHSDSEDECIFNCGRNFSHTHTQQNYMIFIGRCLLQFIPPPWMDTLICILCFCVCTFDSTALVIPLTTNNNPTTLAMCVFICFIYFLLIFFIQFSRSFIILIVVITNFFGQSHFFQHNYEILSQKCFLRPLEVYTLDWNIFSSNFSITNWYITFDKKIMFNDLAVLLCFILILGCWETHWIVRCCRNFR